MAPDPRPVPAVDRRRPLFSTVPPQRAIAIATGCVAGAVLLRLLLEQVVPGVLPFLFTFPAVIGAALAGGTLAGGTALVGCQLLTLAFVLPHWIRDTGDRPQEVVNLALATVSLALAVWATAAFRRLHLRHRHQCERELKTLSLLVNEVDHRTKNNFQIAAALLHTQGLAAASDEVREELNTAAGRLVSIAAIYGNLSGRRPDGAKVALREHLDEICAGLRAGLLPPGVALTLEGDAPVVPATTALTVGLVVNEWVTNAVKHAFPDRSGTIRVRIGASAQEIAVEVRDDGVGLPAVRAVGTGSRLLASLVEALDGEVERHNDGGTVCSLTVPRIATANSAA